MGFPFFDDLAAMMSIKSRKRKQNCAPQKYLNDPLLNSPDPKASISITFIIETFFGRLLLTWHMGEVEICGFFWLLCMRLFVVTMGECEWYQVCIEISIFFWKEGRRRVMFSSAYESLIEEKEESLRFNRLFIQRTIKLISIIFKPGINSVLPLYILLLLISAVSEVLVYYSGITTSLFYLELNNKYILQVPLFLLKLDHWTASNISFWKQHYYSSQSA